jgi:A/G-specific adenine glycosylase
LSAETIVAPLLAWWRGQKADLPWRRDRDPYRVWISEIMLQQTQVATVVPYYERWMDRFPTVATLAEAPLEEVLQLWAGLGYYTRARNLHKAARQVMEELDGRLPTTAVDWQKLPGVGRYTAGAIASIAFAEPAPVLDGNVIRVFTRLYDISADVSKNSTKKALWARAAELVPAENPGDFNQALMELGQKVCRPKKPTCLLCPLQAGCLARRRGTVPERPVKPPRKRIPHYDVVAGVIWENGAAPGPESRFLIAQRPLDGLLGGMWEFPGGKQEPDESLPAALVREIDEELAMQIAVEEPLTVIEHAYTHFRITLHAFHARHLSGAPQHFGVADHAWVTTAQLVEYPFAVTDQKIIAALRQELHGE